MATGGRKGETHSEEVLDFVCTPCTAKNKSRRAETFCDTCNKYYCSRCISFHNEIFTDHRQLQPGEFKNKPVVLLPTERCDLHGNDLLQMYCRDHDAVVCNTCVSIHHRSCAAVMFIPSEVKDLLNSTTLSDVKSELSTSLKTLKNDTESGKAKERKLSDEKKSILETIESHGQMLKAMISRMVEESKKEVEEKYHMMKDQLQEEIEKFQETQKELEKNVRQLDTAEKQRNDSQVFVSMKKCQDRLTKLEKHHADFTALTETLKLEYDINKDIEKSLKQFTSLGSVKDQHLQPSIYTVKGQHTVRVCQDGTKCYIMGSCQLPDGSFLVTDFNHNKIVHLDSSCSRIIDQCTVPGPPYAVCLIGDKEAAVSLQWKQTIQFVSLETKLTLTRCMKLQHTCRGLAFSMGELFISDNGDHVYVYDKAGTCLRTLGTSTPGQGSVFYGTDHIAVSTDGQKLYVSNRGIGLVCVDRTGKHLFTYSDSQLKGARGVCTDDRGSVFVCGFKSHNIIQLSEDGMMLGVLLQQSNGVKEPYSVSFDSKNKRLLVTEYNNSSISVYKLE